jgi:hypothetical protein
MTALIVFISSTLSDSTKARHTCRERVSSAMDGRLKSIHGAWIPAIPAGMTILEGMMMKSDKVELGNLLKLGSENQIENEGD